MSAVLTKDAADECDTFADLLVRRDRAAKLCKEQARETAEFNWGMAIATGDLSVKVAGHPVYDWITDSLDSKSLPVVAQIIVRAALGGNVSNPAGSLLSMAKTHMLESLS